MHLLELVIALQLIILGSCLLYEIFELVNGVDCLHLAGCDCALVAPRFRHEHLEEELLLMKRNISVEPVESQHLERCDEDQDDMDEHLPREVIVLLVSIDGPEHNFVSQRYLVLFALNFFVRLFHLAHLCNKGAKIARPSLVLLIGLLALLVFGRVLRYYERLTLIVRIVSQHASPIPTSVCIIY